MPSKIFSCALKGIEAYGVEIEVDILKGLPQFTVVGLGDTAVQEAKDRVRSALVNSGAEFPKHRKVVNLAPADIKKCGPLFDLAIAVGLLMESRQLPRLSDEKRLFLGELALDGSLRPINGVLSAVFFAKENGFSEVYIPQANVQEALLVPDIAIIPLHHLKELMEHLKGFSPLAPHYSEYGRDFSSLQFPTGFLPTLKSSAQALRTLAIASSGGHHLLMSGPPGSGKTLLAQHLSALLPSLSYEECIELTKIYSSAGLLPPSQSVVQGRPFRSVHHTASAVSLVGGGSVIRPGEISLAHRGVLFLDELPEFSRHVLETLRQPLEQKMVTVSRSSGSITFPAHFILIAAMNPCPCGYFGDEQRPCECPANERLRYRQKLSGPLLDRMDLFLSMRRISFDDLYPTEEISTHPLEDLQSKILRAREIQRQRFGSSTRLNCDLSPQEMDGWCRLNASLQSLLKTAMERHSLSARGCHRVVKVARTLADMDGSESIQENHLLEALRYRVAL